MEQSQITIETILAKCSGPIISRIEASRLTGGLLSPKTLANMDSLGTGCPDRIQLGRRTGYNSHSFSCWLMDRIGKGQAA